MSRRVLPPFALAAVAAVLAAAASAAPVPKEIKRRLDDRARVVGTWTQATDGQGRPVAAAATAWQMGEDGTAYILHANGQRSEPVRYALDPAADPKAFTWDAPWGRWAGVYDLDGDTFRIAIAPATAKTPPPQAAKPGAGHEFYEFTRRND